MGAGVSLIVDLVRQILDVHELISTDPVDRIVLPELLVRRLRLDTYRETGRKDPHWLDDRGELRICGVPVVADTRP